MSGGVALPVITPIFGLPTNRAFGALFFLVVGALWQSSASPAWADEPPAAESGSEAVAPSGTEAQKLDAWMSDLLGADAAARQSVIADIDAVDPSFFPAVAAKLAAVKRSADRAAAAAVMAASRKNAAAGKGVASGEGKPLDAFDRVVALARSADADWRSVVSAMYLGRLMAHIGTTPAVRELVGIYEAFGEALRWDIEQQIKAVGDRALPALIELRRSPARELRVFSVKLLELLNKSVPGEAVQTADNALVGEILRAYGRTKDADAARVIVAFANSDRRPLRQAAREAAMMLGEAGLFALRDAYEGLAVKKPPADWPWQKIADELFVAYDRVRLAELYLILDQGLAAYRAGQFEAMTGAFDRVLARAPSFDRRADMVPGFLALAKSLRTNDRTRAMSVLRKVLHIDPTGPSAAQAASELLYLETTDWAEHGVVDEAGFRRALELDPNNTDARAALDALSAAHRARTTVAWRVSIVVLLGIALLAAVVVTVIRRTAAAR
jgi:hypothetical protein